MNEEQSLDRLRASLSEALRRQAERPICNCGHPDNLHSAGSWREYCDAQGCKCEWYEERTR